jgi:catechol 2,3-dioxygenase-like lactoylglutathione lyase family enzyme
MSATLRSAGTATATPGTKPANLRLEVVVLPVADVDRAKQFYGRLGWRLDGDGGDGDWRLVQMTPPGSPCSIIFGSGVTDAAPGAVRTVLAVDDIDAAREELIGLGADVGEVYHDALGGLAGGFHAGDEGRAPGPDPEGRSYASYASFDDPDGNEWVLQQINERLPGRVEIDYARLSALLRETAEHHDPFEKASAEHYWSDWYAPYLANRDLGATEAEALAAADAYMRDTFGIVRERA